MNGLKAILGDEGMYPTAQKLPKTGRRVMPESLDGRAVPEEGTQKISTISTGLGTSRRDGKQRRPSTVVSRRFTPTTS